MVTTYGYPAARRVGRVALLFGFAFAIGCEQPQVEREVPVRPVKTLVVTAGDSPHTRTFPGVIEASRRVELAFQAPGLIVSLPVKAGQKVAKGEVIAQLRTEEFEARLKSLQGQLDRARANLTALQAGERPEERLRREAEVRAANARLSSARAELNRVRPLMERRIIPRAEFDEIEAAYRVAVEAQQSAQQMAEKGVAGREEDIVAQQGEVRGLEGRLVEANLQLQDTTLRAPYDGVIAERFVEENQNVTAKQPIVRFQDVEEIEIVMDVPESVMAADLLRAEVLELQAEVSGAPGITFPARIGEIAQVADPVTRTFKVRAAARAPDGIRALPGMTASVTMSYRRANVLGIRKLVPVAAVAKRESGQQVVWVIGADGAVAAREVQVGAVEGGEIEITQGVEPGDRIAIAGVTFLRDGMKVRDLGDALGGG